MPSPSTGVGIGANIVSISPITSDTIRELGYEVTVEAKVYTMDGIVQAILAYEDENSV